MHTKVLHISISDGRGGAAIAAYRLHTIMNESNLFKSKMLVLVKRTEDQNVMTLKSFKKQKARFANLINNLLGQFKKNYGLFSFAFIGNELHNEILVNEADVIYIHWVNNGMMSWKSIEKMFLLNKPIFLFGHDMWYFSGGCHQSNGCNQYQTKCCDCPFFHNVKLKKKIISRYKEKKLAYKHHSNVKQILPSSDFYHKAISSNIMEASNISFIPNILDTEKFKPKSGNVKTKSIKILFGAMGGKANPYKGWDDFVYFATIITQKYEGLVEILLFGYDFQPAELANLPFNPISYGVIHNEDQIVKLYQEVDVFVFPSHQESFGQTLFEAMSCGVIPIAYKVGIAPDLIKDSTNGFLVDIRDRDGLVVAFDRLFSLGTENLNKAARASIEKNFSKEIILNKHIALIKSML